MRLTCPNCRAQYEVPDEVIPEEGRDVQCSNCDQTWFQAKHTADKATEEPPQIQPEPVVEPEVSEPAEPDAPDTSDEPPAEPDIVETPAPTPTPTRASSIKAAGAIDPAVASILQEEAAREAELREQEDTTGLETQPDLALDAPSEPKVEPKQPKTVEPAKEEVPAEDLPDVETINYGMISGGEDEAEEVARKSGGFVRGFALMLIVGVLLYLVYGNAQQISEAVPQADPVLSSYVSLVDQARIWLEAQVAGN